MENVARGEFHQNFTPNFTAPLAEANGENFFTPHFCSAAALTEAIHCFSSVLSLTAVVALSWQLSSTMQLDGTCFDSQGLVDGWVSNGGFPNFWQDRTIYHHRGAEILADPAKAMVDMIFLRFVGCGYLP